MKKKIIIGASIFIALLAIAFAYLNYRNRTLSPPGKTELTVNGLTVSIPYSRPSVRGRLIFGTEEQKALQPYGKYWRLGANESTGDYHQQRCALQRATREGGHVPHVCSSGRRII